MKIEKLPKGNLNFTKDKKVLAFIKYCKETYSDEIRSIDISLYDEKDSNGDEWLITISETSENKKEGNLWVPWHIPTTNPQIYE